MRYWISKFSLANYKYYDDSITDDNSGKYEYLLRKSCGRERYSVFNFTTINKIRDTLNDSPINSEEEEAYEDMKEFINFIDKNLDLIKTHNYTIVFYTDHDF